MTSVTTTLLIEHPRELVDRYYPNGKLGGLTLDGEPPSTLGAPIAVTVKMKKPLREFCFHGIVRWARHRAARQPASFGVDFSPSDGASRERLLAFARNEVSAEAVRGERRLDVELAVRVVHEGRVRKEQLADLSLGGAFVRTKTPLKEGEAVELTLRPPLSLGSLLIRGHVVWVRHGGPQAGMGIEFVADIEHHAKLKRLLVRLSETRP